MASDSLGSKRSSFHVCSCGDGDTVYRIVLTGGPGGGKTTAADLLRREFGTQAALVPETATLLYAGGFPRFAERECVHATQLAIHAVQRQLEATTATHFRGRVLLCDRGTVDAAAYWPEGADDFFARVGTTLEAELERYDGVLFFQSAACASKAINSSMFEGGNPHRREDEAQARALNDALHALWRGHASFVEIPSTDSFLEKIHAGVAAAKTLIQRALDKAAARSASRYDEHGVCHTCQGRVKMLASLASDPVKDS